MNKLTFLGYLCFLVSLIFAILGMSIDPKMSAEQDDQGPYNSSVYSHTNVEFKNVTFSQFGTTLAVMGLGFLYMGQH